MKAKKYMQCNHGNNVSLCYAFMAKKRLIIIWYIWVIKLLSKTRHNSLLIGLRPYRDREVTKDGNRHDRYEWLHKKKKIR